MIVPAGSRVRAIRIDEIATAAEGGIKTDKGIGAEFTVAEGRLDRLNRTSTSGKIDRLWYASMDGREKPIRVDFEKIYAHRKGRNCMSAKQQISTYTKFLNVGSLEAK